MSDVARKSALVTAGQLIGAATGYVAIFAITRFIGNPAALGAYTYALSLTGLAVLISSLGLRNAHTHFLAQGTDLRRALGTYLPMRLGLTGLAVAICYAAFASINLYDPKALRDTTGTILALTLVLQVLWTLRNVAFDTWIANLQVHRVEWVRLVENALIMAFVGSVSLAIGFGGGRWVPFAPYAQFIAEMLQLSSSMSAMEAGTWIAKAYLLAKAVSWAPVGYYIIRDRMMPGRFDRQLAAGYLRYGLPLAPQGILLVAIVHLNTILLGFFSTPTSVGLYAGAEKLAGVGAILALSVATVLFPVFSKLHGKGETGQALATFEKAERLLLALSVPAVAAVIALPRQGIHIFLGDAFLPAATALQVLAGAAILTVLARTLRVKMLGAGVTIANTISSLLQLLTTVALDVLLIPTSILGIPLAGLGVEGAAIATVGGALVGYGYLRVIAHRRFGMPLVTPGLRKAAAAGAIVCLLWVSAAAIFPAHWFDRGWELILWGIAGTIAYAAIARAIKLVDGGDVAMLTGAINPRRLWQEMRGRR